MRASAPRSLPGSPKGLCFYRLKRPVVRIGGAFLPMPFAKELERQAVPQAEEIEEAARRLVADKTKRFFLDGGEIKSRSLQMIKYRYNMDKNL